MCTTYALMVFPLWVLVQGSRIPLSDKALPYLSIDTLGAGVLRWNSASLLDEVQRAKIIEISPRGLRFIFDSVFEIHHAGFGSHTDTYYDNILKYNINQDIGADWHPHGYKTDIVSIIASAASNNNEDVCIPESDCLCSINGNHFLPSPALNANKNYNITFSANPSALKTNKVLHAYASAAACDYNGGGGRQLSSGILPTYTVSGCDVLQGKLVALYFPMSDRLLLHNQTLGPMAYTASIVVILFLF
jgi:hypothetical protein